MPSHATVHPGTEYHCSSCNILPRPTQWQILDREVIDEIIFRNLNVCDRLMIELMARAGMWVGEIISLIPNV